MNETNKLLKLISAHLTEKGKKGNEGLTTKELEILFETNELLEKGKNTNGCLRVVWEIDIISDTGNVFEAVEEAQKIMQDADSTATFFKVLNTQNVWVDIEIKN